MAQDACITQINNITQCTNRIRDHQPELYKKYFASRHQKGLTGMRKRMVHDYESVRPEFIWDFILKDVPQLEAIFQKILSDHSSKWVDLVNRVDYNRCSYAQDQSNCDNDTKFGILGHSRNIVIIGCPFINIAQQSRAGRVHRILNIGIGIMPALGPGLLISAGEGDTWCYVFKVRNTNICPDYIN